MTKRQKFALALMEPVNPSIIIVLGLYTLLWGFWIVNPWWSVFTHAALYSTLAAIASEYVWGAVAIFAGLVIIYGALKPGYKNLRIGSFTASLFWLAISVLYFLGDWQNTGGITSLAFAVYAGIIHLNIKVNKHLYQKY